MPLCWFCHEAAHLVQTRPGPYARQPPKQSVWPEDYYGLLLLFFNLAPAVSNPRTMGRSSFRPNTALIHLSERTEDVGLSKRSWNEAHRFRPYLYWNDLKPYRFCVCVFFFFFFFFFQAWRESIKVEDHEIRLPVLRLQQSEETCQSCVIFWAHNCKIIIIILGIKLSWKIVFTRFQFIYDLFDASNQYYYNKSFEFYWKRDFYVISKIWFFF